MDLFQNGQYPNDQVMINNFHFRVTIFLDKCIECESFWITLESWNSNVWKTVDACLISNYLMRAAYLLFSFDQRSEQFVIQTFENRMFVAKIVAYLPCLWWNIPMVSWVSQVSKPTNLTGNHWTMPRSTAWPGIFWSTRWFPRFGASGGKQRLAPAPRWSGPNIRDNRITSGEPKVGYILI